MPIDINRSIDHTATAVAPLLEDLQGNILKGHGRDHSVHLFLKLQANDDARAAARTALASAPLPQLLETLYNYRRIESIQK